MGKKEQKEWLNEELLEHGVPEWEPEHRFHSTRRWRFDYAWPESKVALELEGGAWSQGRHVRAKGFLGDIEKYNEATLLGWKLLRCATDHIGTGYIPDCVHRALMGLTEEV
jgi:hypothetical protein